MRASPELTGRRAWSVYFAVAAGIFPALGLAQTEPGDEVEPVEPPPAAPAEPRRPAPPLPAAPAGDATAPAPPATETVVATEPARREPVLPPATVNPAAAPGPAATPAKAEPGFHFGSYGRMIAATDGKGRPGRDADIVMRGSRLDESNYVELELRREDFWEKTNTATRVVATLALVNPILHYSGDFDVRMTVRNLFIEERGLGVDGLSMWVGSRMYRGDDIYLLDWWPLDSLNTVGGGVRYDIDKRTIVALHGGLQQPATWFYTQTAERELPHNQLGSTQVNVLDRQKFIGSAKAVHIVPVGEKAGIKGVLYGETHQLPEGQRETRTPGTFETLPSDSGYVIGAQVGAFTGERDTHVNLFLRYAQGLAAYGEFATPDQLAVDRTTAGAYEARIALGANYEYGPLGVLVGAYLRRFRNASPELDFGDVDEGIVIARPHLFLGEYGGLAIEGSYQAQQRGVLVTPEATPGENIPAPTGLLSGSVARVGFVPFLSPGGRGSYNRPHFRFIYLLTMRDEGARSLYPRDDVFGLREVEHFVGVGAEWWFNSTSYGW